MDANILCLSVYSGSLLLIIQQKITLQSCDLHIIVRRTPYYVEHTEYVPTCISMQITWYESTS